MLFLLNETIISVAVPEVHLQQRWKTMGCGDPRTMRMQDAVSFVQARVQAAQEKHLELEVDTLRDYAALIISKTGANCLILKPTASGALEPRLRDVPAMVLETYQRGAANDGLSSVGRRTLQRA